jgi:transposase
MDSFLFEYWFSNILLKNVQRVSVIIMDNASFHRKTKLPLMAENCGYRAIFLPPYSPELNPIEKFWNWLKRHLRKIISEHADFNRDLTACFNVR